MYNTAFWRLCVLYVSLISGNVYAEIYMGFGFGSASFDIKPLGFEVDDSIPFRLFIGTRSQNLGFEGEISGATFDWTDSGGEAAHNVSNIVLSGLGYIPLQQNVLSLYGKLGVDLWSTSVDFLGQNYEGDNGTSIAFGGGVDIGLNERFHLRIEAQAINGISDGVDEGDLTQFTFNASFLF